MSAPTVYSMSLLTARNRSADRNTVLINLDFELGIIHHPTAPISQRGPARTKPYLLSSSLGSRTALSLFLKQ